MDSGGVAFHVLIYIGVCGAAVPRFVGVCVVELHGAGTVSHMGGHR